MTYLDHTHPRNNPIGLQMADKKHLLHSSGVPWWQIWTPPGGKVAMTYPDLPPKHQPNQPTDS